MRLLILLLCLLSFAAEAKKPPVGATYYESGAVRYEDDYALVMADGHYFQKLSDDGQPLMAEPMLRMHLYHALEEGVIDPQEWGVFWYMLTGQAADKGITIACMGKHAAEKNGLLKGAPPAVLAILMLGPPLLYLHYAKQTPFGQSVVKPGVIAGSISWLTALHNYSVCH